MRKLLLVGVVVALVAAAAGCKLVVTPTASNGWFFLNEGTNGSGYYVNGPGTPPAGRGSALLTIDGTGRENVATGLFTGRQLSTFTNLKYSTYQAFSGSPNETLYLQFDVDYDSTDSSTAYQGRLVYVPSAAYVVTPKVWQTWDTMDAGAAWYSSASGASPNRPIVGDVTQTNPPCHQTNFCTWSTLMADYPNARVRPTVSGVPGLLLVRAGGPVTGGFVGATDNVIVGISGNNVETNFEPGDGNLVINQSNAAARGFAFVQETANGSGAFVGGPNGSDGSGSAKLTIDSTGGEALVNGLFAGTRLDQLNFLSYKTYQQAVGPHTTTLQLDADYDATDASTSFQGRAVFEPELAGAATITSETWQTWNPLTAPSGWWQTGNAIVGGVNVGQTCTQGSPCSFAELLAAYPFAAIRPITGQIGGQPIAGGIWLKAGGGWSPGFTGNIDSLTAAVNVGGVNGTVNFDFEP
ncbi:MAG: hypothetical protein M3Q30_13775 [Actinomycetota bacterium]|nr:hypothetical protein [Actinomycetota bacterium]